MTQTKNRFSFFRQTREKTEEPTLHQDELPSKADLLPDSVLPVNIQVQSKEIQETVEQKPGLLNRFFSLKRDKTIVEVVEEVQVIEQALVSSNGDSPVIETIEAEKELEAVKELEQVIEPEAQTIEPQAIEVAQIIEPKANEPHVAPEINVTLNPKSSILDRILSPIRKSIDHIRLAPTDSESENPVKKKRFGIVSKKKIEEIVEGDEDVPAVPADAVKEEVETAIETVEENVEPLVLEAEPVVNDNVEDSPAETTEKVLEKVEAPARKSLFSFLSKKKAVVVDEVAQVLDQVNVESVVAEPAASIEKVADVAETAAEQVVETVTAEVSETITEIIVQVTQVVNEIVEPVATEPEKIVEKVESQVKKNRFSFLSKKKVVIQEQIPEIVIQDAEESDAVKPVDTLVSPAAEQESSIKKIFKKITLKRQPKAEVIEKVEQEEDVQEKVESEAEKIESAEVRKEAEATVDLMILEVKAEIV